MSHLSLSVTTASLLVALAPAAVAELHGEVGLKAFPGGVDCDEPNLATAGGTTYAVWHEVDPLTGRDVYFSRSLDGGKSWTTPVRIDQGAGLVDAEDPLLLAQDDVVVVAWRDERGTLPGDDIFARVSGDGGLSFGPEQNLSGSLFSDGADADELHGAIDLPYIVLGFEDNAVAFAADPLSTIEDYYVVASQDSGASFSPPTRVNLPPAGAGTADVDDPELAADDGTLYAVWVDRRNGVVDHVFFCKSADGGLSWSPNSQLDLSGDALLDTEDPEIDVSGSNVAVKWRDARNLSNFFYQVFLVASNDGGTTWSPETRVDAAVPAAGVSANGGATVLDGDVVHMVWRDNRSEPLLDYDDVFYRRADIAGSSVVLGPELRLDVGSLPGTADNNRVRLEASGDYVYVSYEDRRNDPARLTDSIFLRVSHDGGLAFGPELELSAGLDAPLDAEENQLAVTAFRDVVGLWVDDRDAGAGGNDSPYSNGQRFPVLDFGPAPLPLIDFSVSQAGTTQDEGNFFVVLVSFTPPALTSLPLSTIGLDVCFSIDAVTVSLATANLPFFTGFVFGGAGQTFLPVTYPGFPFYVSAILFDPSGALDFTAATDPVLVTL